MVSNVQQAKNELDKIVAEKEAQGGFKRGELKKVLDELVAKYGVSFYTLKNYYYNNKYKANTEERGHENTQVNGEPESEAKDKQEDTKPEEGLTEEQLIQKVSEENQELENSLRTPILRPLVAPYKYGDLVDVEVTKVVSYGAFVKTLDGYEYRGLIHISEIKNGYVDDPSWYFEVGDKIKAKVKRVIKDKIEFTTKGLRIPMKVRVEDVVQASDLEEKLNKIKQTFQEENEDKPTEDKEFKEIVKFINGIVGALSPEAKQRMKEVIKKHGLFKFTIGVTKVSQEFKPDLGLIFIEEVDRKVADGL